MDASQLQTLQQRWLKIEQIRSIYHLQKGSWTEQTYFKTTSARVLMQRALANRNTGSSSKRFQPNSASY